MKPLQYWNPNGFEITSYGRSLKKRANQTYTTEDGDISNLCSYTYNELGFRGDSIKKEGFKVISLGCSNTEGFGVNNNETWPSQFCSHIPNSVNLNFGASARSNDYICRCLLSYYDLIKPDLVLIMYTFPHRREIYTTDNGIEPYIPNRKWGYMKETEDGEKIEKYLTELQNDNEDFINWYKNHLLIKLFLESKKCNWIWSGDNLRTNYTEFNRFTSMDRFKIDVGSDNLHPGPKHHEYYGKVLFDYISRRFPNYINNPINSYNKLI